MNFSKSDYKICVVGLGYVGLPLSARFSLKKFDVIGFDINQMRVEELTNNIDRNDDIDIENLKILNQKSRLSSDLKDIKDCNIFIITVPTPINKDKTPNLEPVINSSKLIGSLMTKGSIVIYESTVYPGVTDDICMPVLERESAFIFNKDFSTGYSPERIVPGDKINTIVGTLITAEPYIGHGQFDPSTEDPTSIEEDETADTETLENQIDPTDDTPADADTPEGTKIGEGFAEATDGIKSVYEEYNAQLSNFTALQDVNLGSLEGITKMAESLGIAIPPYRIPTTNSIMQKIIGQSKILTDLEAQLKQFSLDDLGLPLDLENGVIGEMKGEINGAISDVTGGKVEEFKNSAKSLIQGGDG